MAVINIINVYILLGYLNHVRNADHYSPSDEPKDPSGPTALRPDDQNLGQHAHRPSPMFRKSIDLPRAG